MYILGLVVLVSCGFGWFDVGLVGFLGVSVYYGVGIILVSAD